jgi:hypothetical protein
VQLKHRLERQQHHGIIVDQKHSPLHVQHLENLAWERPDPPEMMLWRNTGRPSPHHSRVQPNGW